MKHNEVKVGETYACQCGGRVKVQVLGETVKRGYKRDTKVFRVRNLKTGRELVRTAAALHPVSSAPNNVELVHIVDNGLRDAIADARAAGRFDRAVGLSEVRIAFKKDLWFKAMRGSEASRIGMRTNFALATFQREGGALPKAVFDAMEKLR